MIPPDDIDEVILSEMGQEALGEFRKVLRRECMQCHEEHEFAVFLKPIKKSEGRQ